MYKVQNITFKKLRNLKKKSRLKLSFFFIIKLYFLILNLYLQNQVYFFLLLNTIQKKKTLFLTFGRTNSVRFLNILNNLYGRCLDEFFFDLLGSLPFSSLGVGCYISAVDLFDQILDIYFFFGLLSCPAHVTAVLRVSLLELFDHFRILKEK